MWRTSHTFQNGILVSRQAAAAVVQTLGKVVAWGEQVQTVTAINVCLDAEGAILCTIVVGWRAGHASCSSCCCDGFTGPFAGVVSVTRTRGEGISLKNQFTVERIIMKMEHTSTCVGAGLTKTTLLF